MLSAMALGVGLYLKTPAPTSNASQVRHPGCAATGASVAQSPKQTTDCIQRQAHS